GRAQDYVRAREWYEKAAANGNATAMFNLGSLAAELHHHRVSAKDRMRHARCLPLRASTPALDISTSAGASEGPLCGGGGRFRGRITSLEPLDFCPSCRA